MKQKFKKSLKLEKRTIRKLDVRSGLRGGVYSVGCMNQGKGPGQKVGRETIDIDCIPLP
jgi:hypothetical protein